MTNTITGTLANPNVPNNYSCPIGETIIWIPLPGEVIRTIVASKGTFNPAPGAVPRATDGSWSAGVGAYDADLNLNYTITFTPPATKTPTPHITINPVVE